AFRRGKCFPFCEPAVKRVSVRQLKAEARPTGAANVPGQIGAGSQNPGSLTRGRRDHPDAESKQPAELPGRLMGATVPQNPDSGLGEDPEDARVRVLGLVAKAEDAPSESL